MGKSIERVLVTNVTAANTGTNLATIISGDILIFNRTFGTALTGSPTIISAEGNDRIQIAQGLSAEGTQKVLWSFPIDVRQVKKATLRTYVAPVDKVQTISFPTTISDRSEYNFNIIYNNPAYKVHQQQPQAERYSYITTNSATQAELAFALANAAGNDRYANISRKVEVLSDGSFSASSGGVVTVTQFSNVIYIAESSGSAADAGKYAADASSMAVGDILRIGGTGATSPLYKITAVSGIASALATITLSEVYQGSTGTVSAANTGVMTAATTYSIRITGLPIAANNIPDLYDRVNFDSTIFEVDGPVNPEFTVTNTTDLNLGIGTWQQVRDKEYLSSGYYGVQNRTMFPGNVMNPATHAIVDNTYDLFTIEYTERMNDGNDMVMDNPKVVTIAFNAAASTKRAAFVDIIESLFESAGIFVEL